MLLFTNRLACIPFSGYKLLQYSYTLQFDHIVPQIVVGMHLK